MADVSTKEKSLLASLIITLLVFGNFFVDTLEVVLAGEPIANIGTSLVAAVISVIILEIIVQSLLASLRASQKDDERPIDRAYVISQWLPLLVGWHLDLDCSDHHTHLVDCPSILALYDGSLSPCLITIALRYRGSDDDGYSAVLLPTRYLIWDRRRSKTTFDDCVSTPTR